MKWSVNSTLKLIFIIQFKHSKDLIRSSVKSTTLRHRGVFNLDLNMAEWLTKERTYRAK